MRILLEAWEFLA